ncbi:alcohol dehydrogenase catalytic domain-containing protein [Blastococcus sp. URHD0036]|uniref:alcohol dehydrogenase catalytic domain-containing protein n=1 Tax=Blastococcus sp. URHD0036 TaxID=1380356 RepID=UPI0009E00549
MKAARLLAHGDFAVTEIPQPTPGPGQVLLRVAAAGMCHSDLHLVEGGGLASALPLPLTLGHETSARRSTFNAQVRARARRKTLVTTGARTGHSPWVAGSSPTRPTSHAALALLEPSRV